MNTSAARKEFGDFQTPVWLARRVCEHLRALQVSPDIIVEPTCGVGGFLEAAYASFTQSRIVGMEINPEYVVEATERARLYDSEGRVTVQQCDFFDVQMSALDSLAGARPLILGNFPWVTSSTIGAIGGGNLPKKSNFQGRSGLDAVTGAANFDVSEWMLLRVIEWLSRRGGVCSMLVKSAVARKVLLQSMQSPQTLNRAELAGIDAKRAFGAAVDASLLTMWFGNESPKASQYVVTREIGGETVHTVGIRDGRVVKNVDEYERVRGRFGAPPVQWRSGIKHDASSIFEISTGTDSRLVNGAGEVVDVEAAHLFPMLKGADVGSDKGWKGRYMIVPQTRVGQNTEPLRVTAPNLWEYLSRHAGALDDRSSVIYQKAPRFAVFGVGDYTFAPWKVAICGLYKHSTFRLYGPIDGRPVVFDDTVYFVSFDSEEGARVALDGLLSRDYQAAIEAITFWDEKRPLKASVLNKLTWSDSGARLATDSGQLSLPTP